MSHLENDRIKEAAWDDFVELYDSSSSFRDLVHELYTTMESWQAKEYGRDDALERIFEDLWHFEADLLCSDKRACVEAFIDYNKFMTGVGAK